VRRNWRRVIAQAAGLADAPDTKRGRSVDKSVGFAITEQVRTAITRGAEGMDRCGRRRRRSA